MNLKTSLSFAKASLNGLLLILLAAMACFAQETFKVNDVSTEYDVTVALEGCDGPGQLEGANMCTGAARVSLYRKGANSPFQVLRLPNVQIHRDQLAYSPKPGGHRRVIYDDEYSIIFDDFNFDGREDLAICNGRQGGYGAPSYNVYLFDKASNRFVENERLTTLAGEGYLGLFFPDPKRKTLTAYSKSGCCYHETEVYRVANNRPVLVEKVIEDETARDEKMIRVKVTTRRLVRGRWVKTVRMERHKNEN
ncbi:MAG: hypothetical protein M3444_22105 [Acidobacteriota bacterium]|nr:hypothetical protein [Acidobacteriota bacterium]MDQ5837296.1 hypothetical protein [Acidobacteriota bacterium]